MHRTYAVLLLGILAAAPAFGQKQGGREDNRNNLVLWYNQPAGDWNGALPIGNGNMGAMVFGGVPRERLQLNESTIWTGRPRTYAHAGAVKYLGQIRELLQQMRRCEREGDLKKARDTPPHPCA